MTRLCVLGPSGRMGGAVLSAAKKLGVEVAATVDLGEDLEAGLAAADVYIDFTTPAATTAAALIATRLKKPGVVGTTGLDAAAHEALAELARVAPLVVAANFSLGVNVLLGLVQRAARALPGWDAEIVEIHHHHKRDAPSGTALAIGRAIADGHGADYAQVARHARDGDVGPRPGAEIGVVAVRGGDVVGEHTAFFFGDGERVEITHRATDRGIFAAGAVRAALWAAAAKPGRHDMQDVLGIR